jgi:hypothetical protein
MTNSGGKVQQAENGHARVDIRQKAPNPPVDHFWWEHLRTLFMKAIRKPQLHPDKAGLPHSMGIKES